MKIIFLATNVNIKARTGDAVHVRELALNLAKLGHHVSLIVGYSPESSEELQSFKKHPNIQISYNNNIFKIPFPRSREISSLWTCLKAARKNPFDVIYERSFSPKIGVVLSKILKKPFIVEINGIAEEEAKLQGTYINNKYTKDIKKKFRKFFFKSANKIVAVAPGIKEELTKMYNVPPGKIVVIPNGANTDVFRHMDRTTVKEELGLSQKIKYVCFVGNLAPWQGVEYLVQAAPMVLEKVPETMFLIVGDGMMRNELEGMVKKMDLHDKFIFTGSVPFEEVPKYINASDVCISIKKPVLPGSPLKVFEYMSCEKPVIATRESAYGFEILEEVGAGLLVDPENHAEVADAIIGILNNNVKGHQMGVKGRKTVVKYYGWENTAMQVAEVCNEQNINKS